jgi:predicted AAA+ superfamily ATPase
MIRQLQPWFENIPKRQVKSPKIYFRDSDLFHILLGIEQTSSLLTHPKLEVSWEGFVLEEVIRYHEADSFDCYFWATHLQAELNLLLFKKGKRLGFAFKYTDSPRMTKSMVTAFNDLHLDELILIYSGEKSFPLDKRIRAEGLANYISSK